jgi:anti-repressor protein
MVAPQAFHATHPVPAVIQDTKGRLVTTSRNVAEVTGKEHDDVLRDIDRLLLRLAETGSTNLRNLMFQEVSAFNEKANRETRAFEMTRDGMTLLVMGYTTPRAMEFKLVSNGAALHDGP